VACSNAIYREDGAGAVRGVGVFVWRCGGWGQGLIGAESQAARSNAMYREDDTGAVRGVRVLAWRRVGQRRGLVGAESRVACSKAMYREGGTGDAGAAAGEPGWGARETVMARQAADGGATARR